MPATALELVSEFWSLSEDAAFYRETDGDQLSYEAKFDWRGYKWSVEFHEDGNLMDIEQLIEAGELPAQLCQAIENTLRDRFGKYRITRIQRRFVVDEGEDEDEEVLEDLLERDLEDLTVRYEMEVDGSSKDTLASFEMMFDTEGTVIQQRKIQRRSLDNIWHQ